MRTGPKTSLGAKAGAVFRSPDLLGGAIIVGTTCKLIGLGGSRQSSWVSTSKIMHDAGDSTFGRGTGCIKIQMITFDIDPAPYRHWRLSCDGPIAILTLRSEEHTSELQSL